MSYETRSNGSLATNGLFGSEVTITPGQSEPTATTSSSSVHPRISAAIMAVVQEPSSEGSDDPIFRLVRKLKAIPAAVTELEMDTGKMTAVAVRLRDELQKELALPKWANVDWFDTELLSLAFEQAWEKVRYAEGEHLLSVALRDAMSWPKPFCPDLPHVNKLVNLAFQLQIRQGREPIILAVNDEMASLLAVSKVTVGHLVWKAQQLGFLIPVCMTYNKNKGQARTFRFDLSKAEPLP